MGVTTQGYAPAHSNVEFRVVDRHGHDTLDLERSDHPVGVTWRNWSIVGPALPARIAEIRADWGNGVITKEARETAEAAWWRTLAANRRKARAALSKAGAAQ